MIGIHVVDTLLWWLQRSHLDTENSRVQPCSIQDENQSHGVHEDLFVAQRGCSTILGGNGKWRCWDHTIF